MIVKLQDTLRAESYTELTPNHHYVVIGIEANDLRLLNDQGRPYLYPSDLFEVVDSREPNDWIAEFGDENERYAYPALLNEPGFFEDFFDAKKEAVTTFWWVINQRLVAVMANAA